MQNAKKNLVRSPRLLDVPIYSNCSLILNRIKSLLMLPYQKETWYNWNTFMEFIPMTFPSFKTPINVQLCRGITDEAIDKVS